MIDLSATREASRLAKERLARDLEEMRLREYVLDFPHPSELDEPEPQIRPEQRCVMCNSPWPAGLCPKCDPWNGRRETRW